MIKVERLNVNQPKPKRFPLGAIPEKKGVLAPEDIRYLLMGKVIIEEKMDGQPVKVLSTDPQLFIFAEDLKRMHSIFYHVPGRYAIFDIFNPARDLFLCWEEKYQLSMEIRRGKIKIPELDGALFFPVPQIAHGKFTMGELPRFLGVSAYARKYRDIRTPVPGEGIVVKLGADAFPEEYQPGKIVREEFLGGITDNYLRLPLRMNAIDPSVEVPRHFLWDRQPIR